MPSRWARPKSWWATTSGRSRRRRPGPATAAGARALSLPFREPTYSVSDLCGELRDLLREAYPSIWVSGEVQRYRTSRGGHAYFELIEKGAGDDIVAKLEAVIWRRDLRRVRAALAASGQELVEGHEIRARCDIDLYPPFGRLQLAVREVDPAFSLGLLARRRQETLAAMAAAGLLERNQGLSLPVLPLRVALVTSAGSAAYHDFVSGLGESGYGFRVLLVHAAVQGRDAEAEIASALAALGGLEADCAVLVRGGGSRTDLAVFDSRRVAEAVARCPLPVLTGLGHQIDQSIADLAAHTALRTPTQAAEFLVARVRRAESGLAALGQALPRAAGGVLGRGRERMGGVARGLGVVRLRLGRAAEQHRRLVELLGRAAGRRLADGGRQASRLAAGFRRSAPRLLARRATRPGRLAAELVATARLRLRAATARLDGGARLVRQLSPQRTLERGFTITRDANGRLVRDAGCLRPGDRLLTRFASGEARSRVEPA